MTIAERTNGEVTILDLQGRLALGDGAEDLRERVNALLAQSRSRIVLQLSGVPFVDSAGLGELIRTVQGARKAGGSAKLCNPTQRILDLLRIAKVQGFIESYGTEEEAVRSFS